MEKIWQLTVRGEFSAAHALRNYKGKCEHIHGHNYHVEMVVEGNKLSEDVELLMDFTILKKILKEATENLDHKDINQFPPFDTINPSAENISCYLWNIIKPLLEKEQINILNKDQVRLYSVTVSERSIQSATYREL